MSRPSGLGKGLGALIPGDDTVTADGGGLQRIPVDDIRPNYYQPRSQFDDDNLESLANSIRELGVLQPLLVRRNNGGFELIAGERRWRAAQLAGLDLVPVIIRDADDMASLEEALVENLHREDLNALEEAAAYQQLVDDFSLTQSQVAKRVGKSRSAVANTIRLLSLPQATQRLVSQGKLTAGHARAILALEDPAAQQRLATQIVSQDLTVRQAEALAKEDPASRKPDSDKKSPSSTGSSTASGPGSTKDPSLLELENLLSRKLDTRVDVTIGSKLGKITIDFADLDDLERIYRIIT